MAVSNTITYVSDFETTLQERLAHPQNWKEILDIKYTDTRTVTTSRFSTVPTVGTVTRGTVFNPTAVVLTAQDLTISTGRDSSVFVDFADLFQTGYNTQMEIADEQGQLLNEFIETNVLAQHASWTDVGDSAGTIATGTASQITVAASNIDDIIRGVKRIIRVANGQSRMSRLGVFIVWRATDFELLEAFMQASGFSTADTALKEGTIPGLRYMGVDHYVTTDNATNHLFAGVKRSQKLGILRSLYGRMFTSDFPADASGGSVGMLSGRMFYSRVDIGHLTPGNYLTTLLDLNVA